MRLLVTSVGRPRVIGSVNGEPVLSGIFKHLVTEDTIFVGRTNIVGDEQADLTVHGGPDKAVYLYPADHWPWWERELGIACKPNSFGENLTLEGADEDSVRIGDRFAWGEAVLEVSQPRGPCYKLGLSLRADAPMRMTVSARCGWYCRVIAEGTAHTTGAITRISSNDGPTTHDAFVSVYHPRVPRALCEAVYAAPALAESWKNAVKKRLQIEG
ncbi:MAG TPA: MOSC domain-containing protein [Rhizomicrobium sp.]|jgi:MOSC domain-containing protein YiiM